MRSLSRLLGLSVLAIACGLLGCANDAGTSTGNPSPDAGDRGEPDDGHETDNGGLSGAGGFCEAGESTELELDEESALGFSGADILAFAAGTHEETIRWHESEIATLGPETGEHTITITVTHDDGDVRYVLPAERDDHGDNGGLLIDIDNVGGGCTPWLEIDVHVTVETDGGALDESFDATLQTRHRLVASLFTHPKVDELGGAFAATDVQLEGFELAQLDLSMTFSELGVNGSFGGVFVREDMGGASAAAGGGGSFADFGDASCGTGNLALGTDDAFEGATVQDVLDVLVEHEEVDITWDGGGTTTGTLIFTPDTNGGCVELLKDLPDAVVFTVRGALALTSADGIVDGTWPGALSAGIVDGAVESIGFLEDGLKQEEMPVTGADYGFPMQDLSAYDFASASLTVDIRVGDQPPLTGAVSLTGFTLAECAGGDPDMPTDAGTDEGTGQGAGGQSTDPGSSGGGTAGCRGSDPTELVRGQLQ